MALDLSPWNAKALYMKALALEKASCPMAALPQVESILMRDPNNVEAQLLAKRLARSS